MSRRCIGLIMPFLASLPLACFAAEESSAPAPPERTNKIRVLLVTGGHDFEHDPFLEAFKAPDLSVKEVTQPDAQQYFAPTRAGEYDVMVWYDFVQKISEESKKDLLDLLNKGKPLVVLHHAIGNYQDWPEALKIMGGRFYIDDKHGRPTSHFAHDQKLQVKVVDRKHPITRFMSDFETTDETYWDLEMRPDVKPLLATDHPKSNKLLAWTHTYGKSPVATIILGHDHVAYENPAFRRVLHQAIRWAAGKLPETSDNGYVSLFNGKDLAGWKPMGKAEAWEIKDGVLRSESGKGGNWIRTEKEYGDFILKVEWRVGKEGNAGVFVRSADKGNPWETGSEVQISHQQRDDQHCTGSLYGTVAVSPRPDESPDTWHEFVIECRGPNMKVFSDGVPVVDVDAGKVPGLSGKPLKGYIGLQDSHNPAGYIEYRKVAVKELAPETAVAVGAKAAPMWRLGTQAYSFRLFTFFEAIDKTKGLGLKYIEAYPGQKLKPDSDEKWNHEASPHARDEVRKKLADAGIKLVNYGVVDLGRNEESARKVFDFAKDMGIETIVAEPLPGLFDTLDKLTEEYKINVAIHNHPKPSRYWDAQTVLDAIKGHSKRIGADADVGHWIRSGLDPIECLKKLEGHIISLHFKDLNQRAPKAHDVPWGTGASNVRGMLEELHRQRFSGVFSIEYEHAWENSVPEIAESVKWFKKTAAELGQKVE